MRYYQAEQSTWWHCRLHGMRMRLLYSQCGRRLDMLTTPQPQSTKLSPNECQDLLPSQLAAFYRSVGGDYDSLFLETPHSTLSFIYKTLGALHSLQPVEGDDGYATPSVPALKHKGYITWQTIQLLLDPEEHVPFLQRAVEKFDIINGQDGQPFPKVLPSSALPTKPDPDMLKWFEQVNKHLTQEAQAEQGAAHTGAKMGAADPAADYSTDDSADEKSGAAKFFSAPVFRDGSGRPTSVRRVSRPKPRSPQRSLYERGKGMVRGVRHIIGPSYDSRRSSYPERPVRQDAIYSPADYDDGPPPNTLRPDYVPPIERAARRAAQARAQRTPSTGTDTESDVSPRSSRRPSEVLPPDASVRPPLTQRRSDDPRLDAKEYFPARYPAEGRRHSAHAQSPSPNPYGPASPGANNGFAPSEAPLFATQVAQTQGSGPPQGRRSSRDHDPRASADPQDRYAYRDERDRDRDRRDGAGSRPSMARRRSSHSDPERPLRPGGRYAGPVNPPGRPSDFPETYRVQSEQQQRRPDRDRGRYNDTREYERRRSRSQPKEERPKMPRYVTPVDGVSGRRYVSPVWGNRWGPPGSAGPDSGRAPLHRVGFADGS